MALVTSRVLSSSSCLRRRRLCCAAVRRAQATSLRIMNLLETSTNSASFVVDHQCKSQRHALVLDELIVLHDSWCMLPDVPGLVPVLSESAYVADVSGSDPHIDLGGECLVHGVVVVDPDSRDSANFGFGYLDVPVLSESAYGAHVALVSGSDPLFDHGVGCLDVPVLSESAYVAQVSLDSDDSAPGPDLITFVWNRYAGVFSPVVASPSCVGAIVPFEPQVPFDGPFLEESGQEATGGTQASCDVIVAELVCQASCEVVDKVAQGPFMVGAEPDDGPLLDGSMPSPSVHMLPGIRDPLELVVLEFRDALELVVPDIRDGLELVVPDIRDALELVLPEFRDPLELVVPEFRDVLELVVPDIRDALESVVPDIRDGLELVEVQSCGLNAEVSGVCASDVVVFLETLFHGLLKQEEELWRKIPRADIRSRKDISLQVNGLGANFIRCHMPPVCCRAPCHLPWVSRRFLLCGAVVQNLAPTGSHALVMGLFRQSLEENWQAPDFREFLEECRGGPPSLLDLLPPLDASWWQ